MKRTTRLLSALAVAGTAVLGPIGASAAHADTATGFTEIKRFDWFAESITAPGGDVLVAVGERLMPQGVPDPTMIAYRIGGTWTEQQFDFESRELKTASDEGIVYVVARTAEGLRFWQTVDRTFVPMPAPQLPAGATLQDLGMAVDGRTVVLTGMLYEGGTKSPVYFTRVDGTWRMTRLDLSRTDLFLDMVGVRDGRMAFRTRTYTPSGSDLYNVPVAPATDTVTPTWLGHAARYTPLSDTDRTYEVAQTASFTNAYDVTLWGGLYHWNTGGVRGECKHFVDGTATDCPAPEWIVSSAARLPDGRTVIGGDPTGNGKSGYALVGTDGSLTALPGSAADLHEIVADPAGAKAWARRTQGVSGSGYSWNETIISEADLSH